MKLKYYCYITIHISNSFKITTTPSLWFCYMALIHITLFLELDVIICYFHVHLNGIKYFLCIKKQRFWFILSIKFFTSKLVCQSRIFFSVHVFYKQLKLSLFTSEKPRGYGTHENGGFNMAWPLTNKHAQWRAIQYCEIVNNDQSMPIMPKCCDNISDH